LLLFSEQSSDSSSQSDTDPDESHKQKDVRSRRDASGGRGGLRGRGGGGSQKIRGGSAKSANSRGKLSINLIIPKQVISEYDLGEILQYSTDISVV